MDGSLQQPPLNRSTTKIGKKRNFELDDDKIYMKNVSLNGTTS